MNRKKKVISIISTLLAVALLITVAVSALPARKENITAYKDPILAEKYTDEATLKSDLKKADTAFAAYVREYADELTNEQRLQMLEEYQAYCAEIKKNSNIQKDPYDEVVEKRLSQIKDAETIGAGRADGLLKARMLERYLEWLAEDRSRYVYDPAVTWALSDSISAYLAERDGIDADEISDPAYALELFEGRLVFAVPLVDNILKIEAENPKLAEKIAAIEPEHMPVEQYCAKQLWDYHEHKNDFESVRKIVNGFVA